MGNGIFGFPRTDRRFTSAICITAHKERLRRTSRRVQLFAYDPTNGSKVQGILIASVQVGQEFHAEQGLHQYWDTILTILEAKHPMEYEEK